MASRISTKQSLREVVAVKQPVLIHSTAPSHNDILIYDSNLKAYRNSQSINGTSQQLCISEANMFFTGRF